MRLSTVTRLLCAAAIAGAGHGTAMATVVDATPSGFTIMNSETVPVDPATAWKAFVGDVGHWWPADHTWWGDATRLSIDTKVGGCFCEIDGERQAWHMSISFVDPGKLMRMTGGLGPLQGMGVHGSLEWRFEPIDDGTRITLHYRAGGYAPEDLSKFAPVIDQVQALQLGGLARFLRGAD